MSMTVHKINLSFSVVLSSDWEAYIIPHLLPTVNLPIKGLCQKVLVIFGLPVQEKTIIQNPANSDNSDNSDFQDYISDYSDNSDFSDF